MSRIHGLTSHDRVLRRADRFLRCLQEELSENNVLVFSTSLIELSSIKTLKLNLSAPVSPLFSCLVWHFILDPGSFWKVPTHRSLASRVCVPLTRCPHCCWGASLPKKKLILCSEHVADYQEPVLILESCLHWHTAVVHHHWNQISM